MSVPYVKPGHHERMNDSFGLVALVASRCLDLQDQERIFTTSHFARGHEI
jgi:hypothetical protein